MLDRETLELAAALMLFGDRELTPQERGLLLRATKLPDSTPGPALRRGVAAEARAAILDALPHLARDPMDVFEDNVVRRPREGLVPLTLVREMLTKPPDRLPGAQPLMVVAPDGDVLFQHPTESVPAVGDLWIQGEHVDRFDEYHPERVWRVIRRTWCHLAVTAMSVRLDVVPVVPKPPCVPAWVLARLDHTEKAPEMWGGPEAVEVLYLTLLELLWDHTHDQGSGRRVQDAWQNVIKGAHPEIECALLSAHVGHEELIRCLRQLRDLVLTTDAIATGKG